MILEQSTVTGQAIVFNHDGTVNYSAPLRSWPDGDYVRPPFGGGGYVAIADLRRCGYSVAVTAS